MTIQTKRIYEAPADADGYRVLVDRLWPRGISHERTHLDLWAKDITPSTALRNEFHSGIDNYNEFVAAYLDELRNNPAMPEFVAEIKKHKIVTLLTATRDPAHSHVPVLIKYLSRK
ncbi:MAG: DUF488 family protein [Bacteroidales bacterium]|jgi:uncharacterized protein YeaO (DUF488 family)|nr:DUF488 family protein [Bacteroidales bacterium]